MGKRIFANNTLSFLIRTCVLLARFGVEKKLLEKSEKFTRFQRLFSGKAVYSFFAGSLVFGFFLIFLATFLKGGFYTVEGKHYYECVNDLFINLLGLNIAYFIAFVWTVIALYISKVSDKLGIGSELKAVAIAGVVGGGTTGLILYYVQDQGD